MNVKWYLLTIFMDFGFLKQIFKHVTNMHVEIFITETDLSYLPYIIVRFFFFKIHDMYKLIETDNIYTIYIT